VARRDTLEKTELPANNAVPSIKKLLKTIQKDMYKKAEAHLHGRCKKVSSMDEMREVVDGKGFALANWCGCRECEDKVKADLQATTRNIPFDAKIFGSKKCVVCGKEAKTIVYFARAY